MIAKVFVFCAVVAAAHATWIGSGILAPGLINGGLVAPGLINRGLVAPGVAVGAPLASAVKTSSVVSIPGAVTSDRRVIGTNGLWAGAPLANGLLVNGLASPLAWGNGIVGPIGLKGAGILAAPGLAKAVW